MNDPLEIRRKRLSFRSHHRGMKENDLLIGGFIDREIGAWEEDDVAWFEHLLADHNDIDLYNWIMGKVPLPEALDHPLMHRLITYAKDR